MLDLRPLFLLRDKGNRKEMTGTQYVGTLKHQFLHYITIKIVLLFFLQKIIQLNSCFLHLCYLVATSTGSKSQLFQSWREWEPVLKHKYVFSNPGKGEYCREGRQ
jgi:hypothetical protein